MSGTINRDLRDRLRRAGRQAADIVTDLLFPRRCPICRKISNGICEECAKKLPYVRQPFCYHCGKPLENEEKEFCASCETHKFAYTQGRALYRYEEPIRDSIYAVKYGNKREYLEYFAEEMCAHLGSDIRRWQPQVLIPVPMHKSARRKRGYNQAEILAEFLGEQMDIPVCRDALLKVRKTANQKELDYHARRRNLHGAFAFNQAYLPWRRVLLVDDVYTTGSTIQEAAKTLRRAGVERVYFVALCIVPENL